MTTTYFASILMIAGLYFIKIYSGSTAAISLYSRITLNSKPQKTLNTFRFSLSSLISEAAQSKKRNFEMLLQMPDFLDLLALALSSGESAYSALSRVVPRMSGSLSSKLNSLLQALELGSDFETELNLMAESNPNTPLSEFANTLLLATRRGTPLAQLLNHQSEFARQELNNYLLKASGRNETRMLVPVVFLVLPVTVLFAIYPSLEMLGASYI